MKRIQKTLAFALALMLMLSQLVVPAFADVNNEWKDEDGATIVITNTNANHTYKAYQIFNGDLQERQRYVAVEGVNYPEFSFDGGSVHVYLASGTVDENPVYKRVSNNHVYTPAAGDMPVVVKEQMLNNITWGAGLTDKGIVMLYNFLLQHIDVADEKYDIYRAPGTTAMAPVVWSDEKNGPDVEVNVEGKFKNPRHDAEVADSQEYLDLHTWLEMNVPAEFVATAATQEATADERVAAYTDYIATNCLSGNFVASTFNAATKNATIDVTTPGQGYYLVMDENKDANVNSATSRFMLRVAGVVQVAPKASVPSVTKKVYENSAYNGDGENTTHHYSSTHQNGTNGNWNDVADYNAHQKVPFMLAGTLPTTFNGYKVYRYEFHDTLGAGLDLDLDSVVVYIVNSENAKLMELTLNTDYKVAVDEEANSFSVVVDDLKLHKYTNNGVNAGCKVIVEYTATLNDKAEIGSKGNENNVYLKYTNDPNYSGSGENSPMGETPKDYVVVYTYELDITKVAQQENQGTAPTLAGAKFKLYSVDQQAWALVDNDVDSETYGRVTGWVEKESEVPEENMIVSATGGKFAIKGLDDGRYQLKEIEAPSGYNLLQHPIEFTIVADIKNTNAYDRTAGTDSPWKYEENGETKYRALTLNLTGTFTTDMVNKEATGDSVKGIVKMTIKNRAGNQLPVTGGMGTTLFYVVGGAMALGAAVVLIAKKRTANEE